MNKFRRLFFPLFASIVGGLFLFQTACEISNGDETVRNVSLRVAGLYQNPDGIASNQSGQTITQLNISQSGDQLNAIDNLGARWTGTIGRVDGDLATLNLDGLTNTGVRVVITGTISISGTTGTLSGTWVEPVIRSNVFAQAVVAAQPTATPVVGPTPGATATPGPTPTPDLTVTPVP